jgi:4-amino-4-deoxy-L-arabinose transferase-like glycosyltransferase
MPRARSVWFWVASLSLLTALTYFHRLGTTVPYFSIEEMSQAHRALVLSATGRNDEGEFLPLYFPEDQGRTVRDPVWVYWLAGLLKALPFSEAVARAPSACAGVLNVALIFLVGRELFGRTPPAAVAAILLMVTPAHFLQSRIATMQIAPVTFTLAWLFFLLRYLRTHRPRDLVLAASALGLGMYSYVAALVVMPTYFLVTLFIVWREHGRDATRAVVAACTGFGLAVLPMVVWFAVHPQQVVGLTGYYTQGEYNRNLGWRGFLGAQAISHFDAWWDCYNPDKLFFSGDPDLRFSTRSAGYFLVAMAAPMTIGLWKARTLLPVQAWSILAAGLLLAPLPAAVVSNSEIKRWITFVPFAVLAAAAGGEWMLMRGRLWRAAVAALVIAGAVQTKAFLDFYHGPYRITAAEKLGGNLRGAIREILAVSAPGDCILFAVSPYYLPNQWELYTRAYGRPDLTGRTTTRIEETAGCAGATALAVPGDSRFAAWRAIPILEADGSNRLTVYRR